jgi:hypothetical protein
MTVRKMSTKTADVLLGATVTLEAGQLAGITRRTDGLLAVSLHEMTRPQILAGIERTMAALEAYPTVPDLLAGVELTLPMPSWEDA